MHNFCHRPIGILLPIGINQSDKYRVLLTLCNVILLLHHGVHGSIFQQLHLTLVTNAIAGFQINLIEVIANHVTTKAVDGGDLGVVNQR